MKRLCFVSSCALIGILPALCSPQIIEPLHRFFGTTRTAVSFIRVLIAIGMVAGIAVPCKAVPNVVSLNDLITSIDGTDHLAASLAMIAVGQREWTAAEARLLADHLVPALDDRLTRCSAASAISDLARAHPNALPRAVNALVDAIQWPARRSDTSETDLCRLVMAVGRLGDQAARAAPALQKIMRYEERLGYASIWAASALARIQTNDATRIDWLAARLNTEKRVVVLAALGRVGPRAKPLVPQLRPFLNSSFPATRVVAASALWRIEGFASAKVLDVLCAAITETPVDFALRPWGPSPPGNSHSAYAAGSLASMGPLAAPMVPVLVLIELTGMEDQKQLATMALSRTR